MGATAFGIPERQLWIVVTTSVVLSVLVHGITAIPAMHRLDLLRRIRAEQVDMAYPTREDAVPRAG